MIPTGVIPMTMTKTELEKDILVKIDSGVSAEDTTSYLYAIGEFTTKAEARRAVEAVLKETGKTPKKKVPMSEQLKTWFHDQPDPLSVTKSQLEEQIKLIGMSGGSVQWYVRVYMEAISISKTLIK